MPKPSTLLLSALAALVDLAYTGASARFYLRAVAHNATIAAPRAEMSAAQEEAGQGDQGAANRHGRCPLIWWVVA